MKNKFLKEILDMQQQLEERGECDYREDRFKDNFLFQYSHTPDNVRAIQNIEYGITTQDYEPHIETYGLKIKNKNVSLADIVYSLECELIADCLKRGFPELSAEEIESAQRVLTTLLNSLEFRKRTGESET